MNRLLFSLKWAALVMGGIFVVGFGFKIALDFWVVLFGLSGWSLASLLALVIFTATFIGAWTYPGANRHD